MSNSHHNKKFVALAVAVVRHCQRQSQVVLKEEQGRFRGWVTDRVRVFH